MRNKKLFSLVLAVTLIMLSWTFAAQAAELKLQTLGKDVKVNDEVTVAVQVQDLKAFGKAGFEVSFNKDVLTYVSVKPGELTSNFTVAANQVSEGLVRVGMFSNTGQPLSEASNGSIAFLTFKAHQKGEAALKLQAPINDVEGAALSGCSFLVN